MKLKEFSVDRQQLLHYVNELLDAHKIKDYCPNGLQVQGTKKIHNIVTGVTACQALIDQAIKLNADAILVHHGYFWKGEAYPITGMKYQRISKLIKNDINLFAYHLPLDIHPTLGNNVQLAKRLNLQLSDDLFDTGATPSYGIICNTSQTLPSLVHYVEHTLKRSPVVIGASQKGNHLHKVAICTGGAQDFIEQAYDSGADVYISGEISERTTHIAKELGIHYIAAGHHATERYGIDALGEHIAHRFKLKHQFIEIDNPV